MVILELICSIPFFVVSDVDNIGYQKMVRDGLVVICYYLHMAFNFYYKLLLVHYFLFVIFLQPYLLQLYWIIAVSSLLILISALSCIDGWVWARKGLGEQGKKKECKGAISSQETIPDS